jgi:hypothetical protein
MRHPDFIYIGPHKTGSTWLFHNFAQHPEIFVPPIKYTNYFNRFKDRPLSWYLKHFEEATPAQRAVGEFGISYLEQPEAPEVLFRLNPQMKFIYFFRDVVDQKISEMLHLRRGKDVSPYDLMEQLKRRVDKGDRNSAHLERWIEQFGRERFFFAKFDRIKDDPAGLLAEVYGFLGVSARPPVPLSSIGENRRQAPRNVQVGRFARHVADRLRSVGMYRVLTRLKHSERVRRLVFRDLDNDETRALLADLRDRYEPAFADEQRRLAAVTGLQRAATERR